MTTLFVQPVGVGPGDQQPPAAREPRARPEVLHQHYRPPEVRPLDHADGTVLPEESIPFRPDPSKPLNRTIVAQGHEWSPIGLWGQPGDNRIWVLDLQHFGAHALSLSQFKQGIIERIVAANFNTFDYRIDARFHLTDPDTNTTNNELSVIVGSADTIWVANGRLGRLVALLRSYAFVNSVEPHCYITEWDSNGDYVCGPVVRISPGLRPIDQKIYRCG